MKQLKDSWLEDKDPNKVISVYGQEKVDGTVKLCQMNLAVHGVSGLRNIRQGNTYYEDIHNSTTYDQDAQDSIGAFDFVMANPPFNVNGVDREKIKGDLIPLVRRLLTMQIISGFSYFILL